MPVDLIPEALRLAQAGIAVFPVNSAKRPMIKGWRQRATKSAREIPDLFKGAHGIGIPCSKDQDLVCFDVDLGHTDDQDRIQKLNDWAHKHYDHTCMMMRQTRSGGLHIVTAWPARERTLPRRLMPKLDVITTGFYFVWATVDDAYLQIGGVTDFDVLDDPPQAMYEVVERDTLGTGAALMSADDAHEAMYSNGDAGQRHDALLRMTQDWANDNPGGDVRSWCSNFEPWFRDIYADRIDNARLEQMLEWDIDDKRGELYRAFAGVRSSEAMFEAKMAMAAEKLKAKGIVPTPAPDRAKPAPPPTDLGYLVIDGDELLDKELESIDWIVPGSIPAGNLISWAGPSGAGKTRYISLLLACLMTGRTDLMGLPRATRPVSAFYFANEERGSDIERRVKAAMVANDLTGGRRMYTRGKEMGRFSMTTVDQSGQRIRNDKLLDDTVELIKRLEVELVVFDPFVTLGSGGESDPGDIDLVNSFMMELAARTGAAVGHVHHTPKDRSAAPDDQRGLDGAWRGHGSIYSALDMGETIFPFLPSEAKDKKSRRDLVDAERAGLAPRYVVVDAVKVREGEMLPSRLYRLTQAAVNSDGQQIGVLVAEPNMRLAEDDLNNILQNKEMQQVAQVLNGWAEALFDIAGGKSAVIPLTKIHSDMQHANVEGWSSATRLYKDRGFGAMFLERITSGPLSVRGCGMKCELLPGNTRLQIDIKKDV